MRRTWVKEALGVSMFSRLAFLFVAFEWVCIAYGMMSESGQVLMHLFVYGSPIYLCRYLLTQSSAFLDSNPYIIALSIFHVLKYFFMYKAQSVDDRNLPWMLAIVLEVAYLAYSGYLLY